MKGILIFICGCVFVTNIAVGMNTSFKAKHVQPLVLGILVDAKYDANMESLLTSINRLLDKSLMGKIELNCSNIVLSETGGLLKAINYFQSNNVTVILDLQQSDKVGVLADYLKVPIVTVVPQSKPRGDFVVSMYPSITVINTAIVEFLLYYQISDVLLLYDERRYRQATNLHTKCQRNYIKIEMMPELHMDNMEMIKQVIRMAWETQIKTVVLLCDTENIKTIVNATLQSRLYDKDRKGWKWIASDMDFYKPDYEPLEGFVGFSLPEPSKEVTDGNDYQSVKTASNNTNYSKVYYACIIDAIKLINQVALKLNQNGWGPMNGATMLEAISNVIMPRCHSPEERMCGLTGKVRFDKTGERKVDELDFVIVENQDLVRTWKWNSDPTRSNFPPKDKIMWVGDVVENYLCFEKRDKNPMKKRRRNFTILVQKSDKPFVFTNASAEQKHFKGFTVDIVNRLKEMLDFDYHFEILKGGGSGKFIDGEWNGLVGTLIKQKADIAVGSFTITADREEVIDFSKPFMDFRMALILKIPEEKESLFNFHKPFSSQIWLMVVLSVFGMTFLLYCVDYFSPLGYRKTAEDEGDGEEFNIMNSLWFATASMLQQGGDNTPKSPSGRILASAFWFFILIIISTYTANLAAFFTNKKIESPIKSLEDLVYRSDMTYGVLKGGQMNNFLQNSDSQIHLKMSSHMQEHQSYASGARAGVDRARKGGYAYISETPILEYYNNLKPCNTMLVKNLLEVKSYGFGLPKNSEFTNELSVAILKLRELGYIEERRKYWWEEKSECIDMAPASQTVTLDLRSLGGVFIVMIAGIVISFVLLAIEVKFKWIIDLFLKAQENRRGRGDADQQNETVMRVEISQGERTLNPINRTEPQRRRWFPSFGLRR